MIKELARKLHLQTFSPTLLLTGWLLSLRSRQGFYALLAWFRLLGLGAVFVRFVAHSNAVLLESPVFLAYLLFSLLILVYHHRRMLHLRRPWFHYLTIILDTAAINYFLYLTQNAASELYLLFFLPLVTAAHFLDRLPSTRIAFLILGSYLGVLLLINPENLPRDVYLPWIGKVFFLLGGTWLYRVQRSLPRTNETRIISPTEARNRLEKLLQELQVSVPYDTVSVQLLYRGRLQIVACHGFSNPEEIYQIEFPIDDRKYPNHLVMETHQPQFASGDDYPSFREEQYFATHIKSWLGVPLISPSTGECFGMLSIDSSVPHAYNRWDIVQAGWFARKASSFLIEAALGPAALTLATNRENLLGQLKYWSTLLPKQTSKWEDDVQAAQEMIEIGRMIFRTEDCSIFFQRQIYENGIREPVLHLVASSSIPVSQFKRRETKVTGERGQGLTGLVVHRNRTLNYGAAQIQKSPYRAGFTEHLKYMFSGRSRQVMICPLRDSQGNAVGAIKIENRLGLSSNKPFFPVEKHAFEIYAAMVGLVIETIRQRNYIHRHDEGVHGLRGVVSEAASAPLRELQDRLEKGMDRNEMVKTIREVQHTLEYVKMAIHGLLSDSDDNLYLEKEGLLHALYRYLKSLKDIPYLQEACDRIQIRAEGFRDHDMPSQIHEVFFNIAREGILNIVRHSHINQMPGGSGVISLSKNDDSFCLIIQDNGIGFSDDAWDAEQRGSFGLRDMKKQIEQIRPENGTATIKIDPRPGQGTLIQVQWAPKRLGVPS